MDELNPPRRSFSSWAGWAYGITMSKLVPRRMRDRLLKRMLSSERGEAWKDQVAEEMSKIMALCLQFGIPIEVAEEMMEEELAVLGRSTPQALRAARRRLFLYNN